MWKINERYKTLKIKYVGKVTSHICCYLVLRVSNSMLEISQIQLIFREIYISLGLFLYKNLRFFCIFGKTEIFRKSITKSFYAKIIESFAVLFQIDSYIGLGLILNKKSGFKSLFKSLAVLYQIDPYIGLDLILYKKSEFFEFSKINNKLFFSRKLSNLLLFIFT